MPTPPEPPDRVEPRMDAVERQMLEEFLRYYRASLELKTVGLTDEQAATASCPPSILTLTGLVRHMSEVERGWFRRCIAGHDVPPIYYSDARPDGDLDQVTATTSLADALAVWHAEIADADAILAEIADIDQLTAQQRYGHHPNVRWVLVHMIEEYARHCGHADLLRERIDGVVGD